MIRRTSRGRPSRDSAGRLVIGEPRRHRTAFTLTAAAILVGGALVGLTMAQASSPPHMPFGHVDSLTQTATGFQVTGWALDPDTTAPIKIDVTADGRGMGALASAPRPDVNTAYGMGADHGFSVAYPIADGVHNVCVYAVNVGAGSGNTLLSCQTVKLNHEPFGSLDSLRQVGGGFIATGWAIDPDQPQTSLTIRLSIDNSVLTRTANVSRPDVAAVYKSAGPNHGFSFPAVAGEGSHRVCLTVNNVGPGVSSLISCRTITLNYKPFGRLESVRRASATSPALVISGWAIDPDTTNPIGVSLTVDGASTGAPATANLARPDVASAYPGTGTAHGFSATVNATDTEHRVCATAINVSFGSGNTFLGCIIINAVHPTPPSAPQKVGAGAGYGAATVNWTAPASDGGAPWSGYTVVASPGGQSVSVGAATTSTVMTDLTPSTTYRFSVYANNVAGRSAAGVSNATTTAASPPAQTSPAPISTSRYIRNVHDASSAALTTMRNEGAADAKANPSGHGYLILLDIGGQDYADNGVVLSATTIFLSNSALVGDVNAYVDGYHSQQKQSAPVIIALGTNNDMDVSAASGAQWASNVVAPVVAHASSYGAMTIAGANDIEPGFRGTYSATSAWLGGYLGATRSPFVFNGSADGCSWTVTNSGCNNGWSMSGLYHLSAGASPPRILNLPQIYNSTMAGQWKFISLTGVGQKSPRVDFAGALTEWTACQQTGSCGSITGTTAWQTLWNDLQSDTRLKIGTLPYSTDLRIDR